MAATTTMNTESNSADDTTNDGNQIIHLEDDLRLRSLRDANRSPPSSDKRRPIITPSTLSHYVWQDTDGNDENDCNSKYKSHFFPMRNPDLVKDDQAVRRWISKPPVVSEVSRLQSNSEALQKNRTSSAASSKKPPIHPDRSRKLSRSVPRRNLVVRHHSR